jgi:hypothetical protein
MSRIKQCIGLVLKSCQNIYTWNSVPLYARECTVLLWFNVFHVRALYYTKTLITNKRTKRVLSSIVTYSYMFRPCWIIFRGEHFVTVTLGLRSGPQTVHASKKQRSTQSTAHSHSTVKCSVSVTVTKISP